MELDSIKFNSQHKWIVTGAAGFIGSHLTDFLLQNNQCVIAIDNFINGKKETIDFLKRKNEEFIENFQFYEIDIRSNEICHLFHGCDYVLHQAAIGSVPRSFKEPLLFNDVNLNGFINVFEASKKAEIKTFVYASSSSVYGDIDNLPQTENMIGNLLSPYALSKRANEIFASFYETSMNIYGLRYFNVFGMRQRPDGPYAAVIPKWINLLLNNNDIEIYGDGSISRDFTYIENVVQANILAALNSINLTRPEVLNIACGSSTNLKELASMMKNTINELNDNKINSRIIHKDNRKGDIQHSYANINRAQKVIQYTPTHSVESGLKKLISKCLS